MNDDTLKAAQEWLRTHGTSVKYYPRMDNSQYPEMFADFCDSRTAELRRRLEVARVALEHYADESFWDSLTEAEAAGYGDETLYNYEGEFDGKVPGHFVASEALKEMGV
jgi:hypothetical protein